MYCCQPALHVFPMPPISLHNFGMDWNEIRRRPQRLIDARGTNPTQLAHASGVSQPNIHRFLSGDTGHMTLDHLAALASALGATVGEIIGERYMQPDEKTRRVLRAMEDMPEYKKDAVVSTAEALSQERERKTG